MAEIILLRTGSRIWYCVQDDKFSSYVCVCGGGVQNLLTV